MSKIAETLFELQRLAADDIRNAHRGALIEHLLGATAADLIAEGVAAENKNLGE